MINCAKCGVFACYKNELEKIPKNCPLQDCRDIFQEIARIYHKTEVNNLACSSARIEAKGYGVWPRMREVIEFSRHAGFSKLGLAFCIGLRREAATVVNILEKNGFIVYSVVCKTGARPKEELGLLDSEKVRPGQFEAMCNPVAQAKLLNESGTELNILLGLCVGHDSLFIKYSDAPVTVLAVKDRALAHNPLGAIYATHYFQNKL